MNGLFLSRTALALDQHRARHGRHLLDLHHHLAHPFTLADQPGEDLQAPALENATNAADDLVDVHRLGEDIDVADRPQALDVRRICIFGEPDGGCALPQLLLHDGDRRRVGQLSAEHQNVGLLSFQRGTDVVERRHKCRVDAVALEHRVDANGGLDVLQRKQNLHWESSGGTVGRFAGAEAP
jgi:hypothetical protein